MLDTAVVHQAGLAGVRRHRRPVCDPARIPEAMERLETLSRLAMQGCLQQCGWSAGDSISREQVVTMIGAASRHAGLLRSWLAALLAAGMLEESMGICRWRSAATSEDESEKLAENMKDAYAQLGFPPIMAEGHSRALACLPRLIRDELRIEQLLFRDGKVLEALGAYQDNLFTSYLNTACGYLARHLAEQHPSPLRVVELGAGAGLTTASTLRALNGMAVDYLFSDLSRIFTVAAGERFAGQPGMRYELLDINTAFSSQGVPPASADLVLAGNVLHNARHLGQTLVHIHQLLAPGGWLLFTESCRDNHAVLTCMQFLLSPAPRTPMPGMADRRRFTGRLFLDIGGWDRELREAGFEPLLVLPQADSSLAAAGQYLFLARLGNTD
ncbi:class I SAM-dependent methyltransferase [Nitrococcus mobilis]|uniref:Pyochelin synthetase F n=1 Tax=Nitrococcus mobilis Nb-231 TaxID=314278 RepID=A4BLS6_9GAMM|nr:class I SAM-dependent methyltransferase [Nitrococcus mobilis]EAR23264.1 pyochelin synthetase F [Nitrococcus mobilis Nb-231]